MVPAHSSRWWLWLAAVWLAAAAYEGAWLSRGWVPHDEGALGESALRVLAGQVPHRDFDEIYTGALSYVNAAAFAAFGTTLVAPRVALYLAFLLWVPAVYVIAARWAPPSGAALAVALAVAWTLPNYSAAMPSWYNLFLATWGLVALLHYFDARRPRALFVAGVAGGLSCLFKIVGLYCILGAVLALVYDAAASAGVPARGPAGRRLGAGTAALAVAAVAVLVRWRMGSAGVTVLVLPCVALAAVAARATWRARPAAGPLVRSGAIFGAGVAVPLVLWAVGFALAGGLVPLARDVFVLPFRRLEFASMPLPRLRELVPAGLAVVAVAAAARLRGRPRRWALVVAGLYGGWVVVAAGGSSAAYREGWQALRGLAPFVTIAGAVVAARGGVDSRVRRDAFVASAVAATWALVQFPFAAPIYFCYTAPLVVLAGFAVSRAVLPGRGAGTVLVGAFALLFAVRWLNPGFIYRMGIEYVADDQRVPLALPRGGLRVSVTDAVRYRALVRELRAHARGSWVYATPDCPEVYFLSGLDNPTRTIFDFLDDPAGRTPRILAALRARDVRAVVLERHPSFSPAAPGLVAALAAAYPHARDIDGFQLRWADGP